MSRQINFKLNQEELAAVEEAMHHAPQAEVRQRATAIRMLHLGNKPETVAELLAVAPSTIWNWHRRYRAAGLSGLVNQAKSGRPAKANVTCLDALARALAPDPRTWGYVYRQPKHDLRELQDAQAKAAADDSPRAQQNASIVLKQTT